MIKYFDLAAIKEMPAITRLKFISSSNKIINDSVNSRKGDASKVFNFAFTNDEELILVNDGCDVRTTKIKSVFADNGGRIRLATQNSKYYFLVDCPQKEYIVWFVTHGIKATKEMVNEESKEK